MAGISLLEVGGGCVCRRSRGKLLFATVPGGIFCRQAGWVGAGVGVGLPPPVVAAAAAVLF